MRDLRIETFAAHLHVTFKGIPPIAVTLAWTDLSGPEQDAWCTMAEFLLETRPQITSPELTGNLIELYELVSRTTTPANTEERWALLAEWAVAYMAPPWPAKDSMLGRTKAAYEASIPPDTHNLHMRAWSELSHDEMLKWMKVVWPRVADRNLFT